MEINFIARPNVSLAQFREQTLSALRRGFPEVAQCPLHDSPLAVVGGGEPLNLEALRVWPGEIWAINGAWKFLRGHGIESTFYSVDSSEVVATMCEGAHKPLLAYSCHPNVFDIVTKPRCFHIERLAGIEQKKIITGGVTTATRAPLLALWLGFKTLTFFGCSSSIIEKSHIYSEKGPTGTIKVKCGNEIFLTIPALYLQVKALASYIREFPHIYREESGGLLRAIVKNGEGEIIWLSEEVEKTIIRTN